MTEVTSPTWVKYAGDLFFLIVFLVVMFCFKSEPIVEKYEEDIPESELPNPLEEILVTEQTEEENLDEDKNK